jgi:hypothetical protein
MRVPARLLSVLFIAVAVALAFLVVPGVTNSGERVSADGPYTLIYYDGHMHTTRSDGSGSVANIKATAQGRGLSAVIVTDHCKDLTLAEWQSLISDTAAASDGSFVALPGFEITGSEGLLNRGHINAYDAADPFVGDDALTTCPEEVWLDPPNPAGTGANAASLTEWAGYVHSQGGIAQHNHTSGSTQVGYGVNLIEVYNQSHVDDVIGYAKMLGYSDADALGFALTLNNLNVYGERDLSMLVPFPGQPAPIPLRIAIYYATLGFTGVGQWLGAPQAPLNSWDDLLMAYVNGATDIPTFGAANSDSHNTGDPGSTVGVAKNGLLVTALTPEAIYGAIQAGRLFATTGPSLTFDVNGKQMGETLYTGLGGPTHLNLSANSASPTAILVKIDIIKNGDVLQTLNPMAPSWAGVIDDTVNGSGYYRVEVTSLDMVDNTYHFAYANPVFFNRYSTTVGGTVDLRDGSSPASVSETDSAAPPYIPLAAAAVVAVLTIAGGTWYARKRWAK